MLLLRSIIGILCVSMPALIHSQTPTLKATLQHTFKAHSAPPRQLAFVPDSKILATSGDDRTVGIWRVSDGRLLRKITLGIRFTLSRSALTAGGSPVGAGEERGRDLWKQIVGNRPGLRGSDRQSVRLWRVRDGALQQPLNGYLGDVWSVAFSPDGRWLATTSEERTLKLWRLAGG